MRNVMQEQDVPDWKARLAAYVPETEQERRDRNEILLAAEQYGTQLLFREHKASHFTCSGFIMDAALKKVLMVYHRIYDSFAWTGGHADGSNDFLWTAVREAKEETGIRKPYPLTGAILSLDILPVKAHQKNGMPVPAHQHYNVTYGLIADTRETLHIAPDENTAVEWIPVERLPEICKEPHMLPVYEKVIARMRRWKAMQEQVMAQLAQPLLAWYPGHARDLPWRRNQEPYRVWLSEIMLQQTRVQAVLEYYARFMAELPDVYALAAVGEERLFKLWEGLGYYSRARNLHRAAQILVNDCGGEFPRTREELLRLPGVGDYTASAIASIAFGEPEPAVDGNLLRVAARVGGIAEDIMDARVRKRFRAMLTESIDCERPGEWNQAMMDLGATVCLPNGAPLCEKCPARAFCAAYQNGMTDVLPVRAAKKPRRVEERTVFLLVRDGRLALRKRPAKGLLAGLWELPNVPGNLDEAGAAITLAQWGLTARTLTPVGAAKHIFSHVEWDMHGYLAAAEGENNEFLWADGAALQAAAIPSAFRYYFDTAVRWLAAQQGGTDHGTALL